MILKKIAKLLVNMKAQNILRQKYNFAYNKKTVEVMLFIDETPFKLLIGVYNTNCSLFFDITINGIIDAFIEKENYNKLKLALGINSNNQGIFNPTDFFNFADTCSPNCAKSSAFVKPQDRFRYDRNIEESNKIYFIGYRDNSSTGGHVTNFNFQKTSKAFGYNIAVLLKQKNISTRWTDIAKDEVEFFLPNAH